MATLDAAVWLMVKDNTDVAAIHDKYTNVYNLPEQMDFLWLYLYYATQADHQDLVKSILDRIPPYIDDIHHVLTDRHLATCVNEAVRKKHHCMIQIFLDRRPELCTSLGSFYAAETDKYHLAFTPIGLAITLDHEDTLALLIDYYKGQPMEGSDDVPLHSACKRRATKCFQFLISTEKGLTGINTMNSEGWTPLLYAALYHPDAIPQLVQNGADVAAARRKRGNALQILSNWSVRDSPLRCPNEDPCPTLGKIPRFVNVTNENIFLCENFVPLARSLIEAGIDVNTTYSPLRTMVENVNRRFMYVRDNEKLCTILKEGIAYLAGVSNQDIRDGALRDLSYLVKFVASQLKRCRDYDNMVKYIDLLPFIRDLTAILLKNGADANATETSETSDKMTRGFSFLVTVPHPCAVPLRKLIANHFADEFVSNQSSVDIAILSVITMFTLQFEEAELYSEAMATIHDITRLLCKSGGMCRQLPYLFTCLCLDPKVTVPILHSYLECLNQEQYHHILGRMAHYTTLLPSGESSTFAGIKTELTSCQNRLYSLKNLLRRDIVSYLGGRQHAHNITAVALPPALQTYIMDF